VDKKSAWTGRATNTTRLRLTIGVITLIPGSPLPGKPTLALPAIAATHKKR